MFDPLALDEFESRTGIRKSDFSGIWDSADRIVALRDLTTVTGVQAMPWPYLEKLIRGVTLAGDRTRRPYRDGQIRQLRMDPRGLTLGQTFIQRSKYQALLEHFGDFFRGFCVTNGVAKSTAAIVLGRTADGTPAIAHYLPPIVEEHDGKFILMDGVHRNFLVRCVGTTIESIVVRNVAEPFPCDARPWEEVQVTEEKPAKDQRFFNLRPELFRDVKHIGIDG